MNPSNSNHWPTRYPYTKDTSSVGFAGKPQPSSRATIERNHTEYALDRLRDHQDGKPLAHTNRHKMTRGVLHIITTLAAVAASDLEDVIGHLHAVGARVSDPDPNNKRPTRTQMNVIAHIARMLTAAHLDGNTIVVPWAFHPDHRPAVLAHALAHTIRIAYRDAHRRSGNNQPITALINHRFFPAHIDLDAGRELYNS